MKKQKIAIAEFKKMLDNLIKNKAFALKDFNDKPVLELIMVKDLEELKAKLKEAK